MNDLTTHRDRAERLGCVNPAPPSRCAQAGATVTFAGEVEDVAVMRCESCGWPTWSRGHVVVVDDRDLTEPEQAKFRLACEQLGIDPQDRVRARDPRRHRRSSDRDVRVGFDERGRRWGNRGARTETFGKSDRLKKIVLGEVARRKRLSAEVSLADFGCGTGGLLERAMRPGGYGHFAGVDLSSVMIAKAETRLTGLVHDVPAMTLDLVVSGADRTPLRADSFDLVTAELVLHHMKDPRPVLAEMARVARPGGRVVVQVPGPGYSLDVNYGNGWRRSPIGPKRLPGREDPLGRFAADEIQALAMSVGLQPEHVDVDSWRYRFETAASFLSFMGRTGADARIRGYAARDDLLATYEHILQIGPLEIRGEFVTLTAVRPDGGPPPRSDVASNGTSSHRQRGGRR